MPKTAGFVQPFRYNTGVEQTDGYSERRKTIAITVLANRGAGKCHVFFVIFVLFYEEIFYTPCPKNVTPLACYNFDVPKPILIILATYCGESKQSKYALFFYLT